MVSIKEVCMFGQMLADGKNILGGDQKINQGEK